MQANLISLWSTWSWRSIWTLWEWGTGSLRHNVGHRSRESFPKTYLISFHPWGATFSFPTLQHGERESESTCHCPADVSITLHIKLSSVKHCTDVLNASFRMKHSHCLLISFMLTSELTVIQSNILAFSPFDPGLPCNKRRKNQSLTQQWTHK